jgi:hypothetical protein
MDILKITRQNRHWWEIILWWELRRIPFNIIMYFIGLASFYVAFVTIPLVYLVIAFLLNIGYALCWIIELVIIQKLEGRIKMKFAAMAFFAYLVLSIVMVFGFAFFLYLQ